MIEDKSSVPEVTLSDLVRRFHRRMSEIVKISPTMFMDPSNQPLPEKSLDDDTPEGSEYVLLPPIPYESAEAMYKDVDRAAKLVQNHLEGLAQEACYVFAQEAAVSRVTMTPAELADISALAKSSVRRWVMYFRRHVDPYDLSSISDEMKLLVAHHARSKKRATWKELTMFISRVTGLPIWCARNIVPRR